MEGVEQNPRKFLKHCQINWVCKWRLVHSCRHLPAPAWPGMRLDRSLAVRGNANRSQRASWRSDWHRATPQPTLANLIVAACQDKVELETNWLVSNCNFILTVSQGPRPGMRNPHGSSRKAWSRCPGGMHCLENSGVEIQGIFAPEIVSLRKSKNCDARPHVNGTP